jgi:hypothetical protein
MVFSRKVNEGRVAVGKREFDWENPNPLLLNLLGQVPLIRKVSNSKFSFEVHFSKKLQRKEERSWKMTFKRNLNKKETLNVSLLIGMFEKRKRRLIHIFF